MLKDNPEKLEATLGNLLPIIVKALQDLKNENDKLKIQNSEVISQNRELENRLSKIENMLNKCRFTFIWN